MGNQCSRDCLWRNRANSWGCSDSACSYMDQTSRSRVKAVYELLGVREMTPEARRMLEPENCPCFEPDPNARKKKRRRGPPPSPPRIDEAQYLALHNEGLLDTQIANRLGVNVHAVRRFRKKLGLQTNFRREYVFNWDKARQLYDQGATDAEIMRALGCSRTSVQDWRKREGLITNYVKK